MADNKRETIRYELAGDDSPSLSPATSTPATQRLRNTRSTGDLSHAPELPGDFSLESSSAYKFANFLENDVKIQGNDARVEIDSLVPKPVDWEPYIDVCGFFFRDPPQYHPPTDLVQFLQNGPPPVCIGFGSIVLDNPEKVIGVILDPIEATGARAIISKGWSSLVGSEQENVYWIGDCPHEWLFRHVAAVIHHGGAGTTACGLRNGKPTTIVPFFGDQLFWGQMVANAGAGPAPIPHTELTVDKLAVAIRYCLSPQAATAAATVADKMPSEVGVRAAVQSFHKCLPLERIRCDVIPIDYFLFQVPEQPPIHTETTRWDPVSGGASAVMATATGMAGNITGIFTKPIEEYRDDQKRRAGELKYTQGRGSPYLQERSSDKDNLSVERLSNDSVRPRSAHSGHLAGRMAGASAKSAGKIGQTVTKGMLVDFPLAITEGLKSVPHLYGGNVRNHGPVKDAKSGMVVAASSMVSATLWYNHIKVRRRRGH
ncbi:hypothetical protein FPRO06_07709 [Fusarium proliferatum]|nr:hypothetical protein FPRO06_07709 [Fusarium proliferatum]